MLLHFVLKAISGIFPDIAIIPEKYFFKRNPLILLSIFSPSGESISLHRLRCSPFAVVHYSFMGRGLAAAAISSRE
jgi:hypothetical protein